jgi:acyl transferase domain-containing protein
MGKSLITSIPFARHIIDDLDRSLASLPPRYRPAWTLLEQFMLDAGESNVMEATFAQPLCTAVQIVLVELLGAAGYAFKAVVGHSSGEIACAFAAGHITAAQAIRIAYLRGHITGLASSPAGVQGAMLAAGTTFEDAQELCALDLFAGRMCVAASNAPDSVTLSGDIDAIEEAQAVLEDEAKFARLLKVDKAYHSHHMLPCSRTYLQALISGGCANASSQRSSPTIWISSVYAGKQMSAADVTADYWTQNLVSPVLFSQAVTTAMTDHLPFDSVVEVGCHAALKGPCLSTIQSCIAGELPYTGCMRRGEDDVESFARALGYLWEHFGSAGMDLPSFRAITSADTPPDSMAKVLPQYPWDNQKSYWVNSRSTRDFLNGEQSPHSLLGKLSSLSTASTLQWHNFVRPRDIKWLDGHQLQGQTVFPGAAYAIMAMEAAKHVAGDREIQLLEVLDLKIGKAITFDDENSLVEINLTLDLVTEPGNTESIVLRFNCDSCLAKESALSWSAGGILVLTCGPASAGVLPLAKKEPAHMAECSVDKLYDELDLIGYGYTNDFRGLTKIRRSTGRSTGTIRLAGTDESDSRLVLHPATLDVAFQAFISAYCAPGDGRLRSLHVPTSIGRIAVNPWLSAVTSASTDEVLFNAFISKDEGDSIGGEVEVFNASDRSIMVQVEGISFKPFSPPTSADDKPLFSKWVWGPLNPDPVLSDKEYRATDEDAAVACDMERMLFFYLRQFLRDFDQEDRLLAAPHTLQYVAWAEHIMELAATGQHPWYASAWDDDKITDIDKMCQR